MLASLFVGRWQPFHKGHYSLITSILKQNKPVIIAIRDTSINRENPYSVEDRKIMILKTLKKYLNLITIIVIPDIDEICHGRKVGYKIRRIKLSKKIEAISGTKLRK